MFKKPFKVKSNVHIKGSDRKKLKMDILKSFPELSSECIKNIFPLKESITNVKIVTDSDEIVQLYCRNKLPLLFSRGVKLYPTIYMLWEYPDMLPYFTTHSEVLPMLQGGAHLMVAGVALEKGMVTTSSFGRLNKHDTVFINLLNNKAAIAVGETVMSSEEMFKSHNKGKAVGIIHIYGDELFKFGEVVTEVSSYLVPNFGPVTAQFTSKYRSATLSQQQNSNDASYSDVTVCAKTETNSSESNTRDNTNFVSVGNTVVAQMSTMQLNEENDKSEADDKRMDMDTLLEYCFVKALKTTVRHVKLPLIISTFYKMHVIPACPADYELNVKKSSYKKISKFIQTMSDKGIIDVTDVSAGVQSIATIRYSHEILHDFKDAYGNGGVSSSNNDKKVTVPQSASNSAPLVNEMYTVTHAVLPIFQEFLIKKGKSVTISDARKYVTEYIKKKNLRDTTNASLIKLDDTLKNILGCGDKNMYTWGDVIKGVLEKMGHSYKVSTTENLDLLPAKQRKGKLPLIDIRVVRKSGNKKVTTVDNLELYNVSVNDFYHNCQIGAAASATVNHPPNLKGAQVQIQGSQVAFVKKLLSEKYQIPAKYVREVDTGVKQKK